MCNRISLWLLCMILICRLIYWIFLFKIVTLFIIYICRLKFWRCSYFRHSITFIVSITSNTCSSWIPLTIFFYDSCAFFKRSIFIVLKILFHCLRKIGLRIWMSYTIVLLVILLYSILSIKALFWISLILNISL